MGATLGIDLGTTNSGVAVFEGKAPRMILNDTGGNITPSAVWESPSGELIVGGVAYKKAGAARRFKRMMGGDEKLLVGGRQLAPEDVSSLILRKLVEDAEKTLRDTVEAAVITVPANWKDGPRRATEAAGRLAGFRVERLINEPTAAAMAYGMREDADGKTIAVYDLGGGTFDVTLLGVHQRVFDVITSNGDPNLGGIDFDLKLMNLVISRLRDSQGYVLAAEEGQDEKLRQRVRNLEYQCEEAKKELSFAGETVVNLPFLDLVNGTPLSVEETITRANFEALIEEDVQRTLQYLESALRDAKLQREAIDEIVLVGGSSRIPLVRQRVAEFFGKEPLTSAVNPDEAVALGAAIQAGIIGQDEVGDDSYVTLDIINNTLGVEVVQAVGGRQVDGVFSPILKKGLKVPVSNTEAYSPAHDGQTSVMLRCFEGESPFTKGNTLLDEIRIEDLPPGPAGELSIGVTFSKSVSDTLHVGWAVEGTQLKGTHVIEMRSGLHTVEEFNRRKKDLDDAWAGGGTQSEGFKKPSAVEAEWRKSPIAGKFKALIDRVEVVIAEKGQFEGRADFDKHLADLKDAVAGNNEERAEELDLELTDMLFDLE